MKGYKFLFVPNDRGGMREDLFDNIEEAYCTIINSLLPVPESESDINSAVNDFEYNISNYEVGSLLDGSFYKVETGKEPERVFLHMIGPNGIGAFVVGWNGTKPICIDRFFVPEPETTEKYIREASGL